ncbi:tetratricopeptide repeat protein [Riemerella anatipestifer]|uniref:tetratricopeptide repeat protein n=1 Tax=Riemerella anatipestifer TaxID=34085 RepID=UPI0007ECBB48|nr:hypothetical protein [Riemerella anatipestifer]MCW0507970.1 hypothetical protein [Riemerella anatipestifer]MCW0518264.1 hypothetical protein [Riemerella anatipestifer]OBP46920.1 hypothetical protein AWM67_08510 [Riemerella anatipestifer]
MKFLKRLFSTKKKYEVKIKVNNEDYVFDITDKIERHDEIQKLKTNKNSCREIPKEDEVIISHSELDTYKSAIPTDVFIKSINDSGDGYNNIVIKKSVLEKMKLEKEKQDRFNELLNKTAELNNKGIALEKAGNIEEAIGVYNECVELGYTASHAYERLMILYRKIRECEKEKEIIQKAINKFNDNPHRKKDIEKWIKRLDRLMKKRP